MKHRNRNHKDLPDFENPAGHIRDCGAMAPPVAMFDTSIFILNT